MCSGGKDGGYDLGMYKFGSLNLTVTFPPKERQDKLETTTTMTTGVVAESISAQVRSGDQPGP